MTIKFILYEAEHQVKITLSGMELSILKPKGHLNYDTNVYIVLIKEDRLAVQTMSVDIQICSNLPKSEREFPLAQGKRDNLICGMSCGQEHSTIHTFGHRNSATLNHLIENGID